MTAVARGPSSCLGRLVKGTLLGASLVAVALVAWAFLNVPPSSGPVVRDRLSAGEVAILRESQALRRAIGDTVWPGFGRVGMPVQLYNDRFGFVPGWPPLEAGMRSPESASMASPATGAAAPSGRLSPCASARRGWGAFP
jgi:hypothetical protein